MNMTPKRTKEYPEINEMLAFEGVSRADRIVTLDGHDFACRNTFPIDFITFDED